jgi:hypothetical protein
MQRVIWNDRVGETLTMGKETRTLIRVILNNEQRPVLIWESGNTCGACVPGLWDEWKGRKERRGRN